MITVAEHPLLDLYTCRARWPSSLGEIQTPEWLSALCELSAQTPFSLPDDAHKVVVRDLLRHGGFKPAGRSKPCWEYIRRVAEKGNFPRINPAVDATNAACMHGAVPVSTVDLDRLTGPLRVDIAPAGARYVFNASGQEIDLSGLLCLFDANGPCANSVKDSQRAKTTDETTRTLTLVWGTVALPGRGASVASWYSDILSRLGAAIEEEV